MVEDDFFWANSLSRQTGDGYKKLLVAGPAPGILYGWPKVNKPDFFSKLQFWIIFASYNAITFGLYPNHLEKHCKPLHVVYVHNMPHNIIL